MGLKLLVNATEDFTGEFRKTANTQAQWKMNDSPSGDLSLIHIFLPLLVRRQKNHRNQQVICLSLCLLRNLTSLQMGIGT